MSKKSTAFLLGLMLTFGTYMSAQAQFDQPPPPPGGEIPAPPPGGDFPPPPGGDLPPPPPPGGDFPPPPGGDLPPPPPPGGDFPPPPGGDLPPPPPGGDLPALPIVIPNAGIIVAFDDVDAAAAVETLSDEGASVDSFGAVVLDADGNGSISSTEAQALQCLGDAYDSVVSEDADGLTRTQFEDALAEHCDEVNSTIADAHGVFVITFDDLDADSNGALSSSEAEAVQCLADGYADVDEVGEDGLTQAQFQTAVSASCELSTGAPAAPGGLGGDLNGDDDDANDEDGDNGDDDEGGV